MERVLDLFTVQGAPIAPFPNRQDKCHQAQYLRLVAAHVARSVGERLEVELAQNPTMKEILNPTERSPRTHADEKAFGWIRKELTKYFPNSIVGGEESQGWKQDVSEDRALVWIVDSIDGTILLLHEIPLWCIAIGAAWWYRKEDRYEPICGVVYQPSTNELFHAQVGVPHTSLKSQAFLSRLTKGRISAKPLTVSGETDLQNGIVATHLSASNREAATKLIYSRLLPAMCRSSQRVLMFGSGQLALCYLAAARVVTYANPIYFLLGCF